MSIFDNLKKVNCVRLPFEQDVIDKLNDALAAGVYVNMLVNGQHTDISSAYTKLEFSKIKVLDKHAHNAKDQSLMKNIFITDGCCSEYVDIFDGLRIEIYNRMPSMHEHSDTMTVGQCKSSIVITASDRIQLFYDKSFRAMITTSVGTNNKKRNVIIVSPLIEWLLHIGIIAEYISLIDETANRMGGGW